MSNQFFDEQSDIPAKTKSDNNLNSFFNEHLPGKITGIIGSGKNARDSFVYLTLRWSFNVGVIITVLIVANNWIFRSNEKVPDLMGDIKITWELVIPIITLALGYAFGKSEK